MPPQRRVTTYSAVQAAVRLVAWVVDICTILVLAWVLRCWPGMGAATAAGFVGAIIALLNDSWEAVSRLDTTANFMPQPPARAAMHDMVCMAISLGGVMVLLFTEASQAQVADYNGTNRGPEWDSMRRYSTTAHALLATVAAFRFLFALWCGCDCSRQRRRMYVEQGSQVYRGW